MSILLSIVAIIAGFVAAVWLLVSDKGKDRTVLHKLGGRKVAVFGLMFYVATLLLFGEFIDAEIWRVVAKWIAIIFGGANILEYGGKALIAKVNGNHEGK